MSEVSSYTIPTNSLVIGDGVKFSGSITAKGRAVINGSFDGELTVEQLVVGDSGKVSGEITSLDIEVHGELNKTIRCAKRVLIHATGAVKGSMEYGDIEIERGGIFTGSMTQK
jgi:cytoskeletal protein CcmA (bactofilin family)